MTTVSVEHLASVVRLHQGDKGWGERYYWTCPIRWLSPTEVVFIGAQSAPSRDDVRIILEHLESIGVRQVIWDRRKEGKSIKTINVNLG